MTKCKWLIPIAIALLGIGGCVMGVIERARRFVLFSFFGMLLAYLLYSAVLLLFWAWNKGLFQKADQSLFVSATGKQKRILGVIMAGLILFCTLPMGLSPHWNGEVDNHRNQYEVMADSILNGHLYMDYEVDPILASLENPYDPDLRSQSGASYHWDHAFYQQKYYMYFGIVPVFLTFIPYRLLTGMPLTAYHATQLYAALTILGIFALFGLLTKLFFRSLSLGRYTALSTSFSAISIWYSCGFPALYCTAATSAICLMVWSLYFFIRAVWAEPTTNRQILSAFVGSLLGALAFGCRPPIALANLLVVPLLAVYLKRSKLTLRLFCKLLFAASPYLVVAILLMAYNDARFDNPFEFGQSYQLTIADQTQYMNLSEALQDKRPLQALASYFFSPFIPPYYGGVLMNFPVLLLVFGVFSSSIRTELKKKQLLLFAYALLFAALFITIIDILWSPYLIERYQMDIYFILCILSFLIICIYGALKTRNERVFDVLTYGLSYLSLGACIVLFLLPNDSNWTYCLFDSLEKVLSSLL